MNRNLLQKSPDEFSLDQRVKGDQSGLYGSNKMAPKNQSLISVKRKQNFLKLVCISLLAVGFLYYRLMYTMSLNSPCIYDSYQEFTFDLNRKLQQGWDNLIIGIGQILMDGWILVSSIFWLIRVKTFRFPFTAVFFYGIRSFFLLIEKFPFPQNMVWHNPGFISLTVPYDHTRDFYFSGHTGALIMILLQFSQFTVLKSKRIEGYIWVLAFFSLIYMMNMLIITRVHYTIDIIGGMVFSIYFYWLISNNVVLLDKIVSLPYFYIISPLIQKIKSRRQRIGQQNVINFRENVEERQNQLSNELNQ